MSDTTIFDLLVRAVGEQFVSINGARIALRDLDIQASIVIAEAVLHALPKEVLIGCGGCGGEPIVAGFREDGFNPLAFNVAACFGLTRDDADLGTWAKIDVIPLIWRLPNDDILLAKLADCGSTPEALSAAKAALEFGRVDYADRVSRCAVEAPSHEPGSWNRAFKAALAAERLALTHASALTEEQRRKWINAPPPHDDVDGWADNMVIADLLNGGAEP